MPGLELAVGLAVPVAIAIPHLVPLQRVTPAVAATIWISALALRALVAIGAALFVLVYMPQTGVYDAVAHWCWHEVLPVVTAHLGLSGHPVVHVATILPGLTLAASLLWVAFGLARAWLALRRKLRRVLGPGPLGSTIIEDDDIVVGVTELGRSRIVVSDAALASMDDEEIEASLSHELGHIHRRHRPLLLAGAALSGLGRPLPGTGAAGRELRFSLERDADEYAVRRTRDPLALASAICKAASGRQVAGTTGLGSGGRVLLRLDYLQGQGRRAGRGLERASRLVAVCIASLVIAVSVTLPSWALAVPPQAHDVSATASHCA